MRVLLQCGSEILIDDDDAIKYIGVKLSISTHGYVLVCRYGSKSVNYLHREVMNPADGAVVDHINGDKVDCRKSNLRVCTQQENSYNARVRSDNKSGVRGVYFDNSRGAWSSQITVNKKTISLGQIF